MAKIVNRTDKRKALVLEKLKQSMGIVSSACESAGICRETFYSWKKKDPEFAKAVEERSDRTGDLVEGALLKKIKEGDTTATIFYCKTKLKNRGYIERTENANMNVNFTPTELAELPDDKVKAIAELLKK